MTRTALMIVDMQRSYLDPSSDHNRIMLADDPAVLDHVSTRCRETVIPNIRRLLERFRERNDPVVFLRLCGRDPERRDMHRIFRRAYLYGLSKGYANLTPLETDPFSDVIEELRPGNGELVVCKTTYSPFTSTGIADELRERGIGRLVMTGITTSQCVETTARDASDHGFEIVQIEDAQADYDEESHTRSLANSGPVCDNAVMTTEEYLKET